MQFYQHSHYLNSRFKRDWLEFYDSQRYQIAFTGTCRQVLRHSGPDGFPVTDYITVEKASKNVDLFMNSLSRKVLGRSKVGLGFQLCCAGAIEGHSRATVTGKKRMHVHVGIGGIPPSKFDLAVPKDFVAFDQLIRSTWRESPWGYNESEAQLLTKDEANLKVPCEKFPTWRGYIHKDLSRYEPERLIYRIAFMNN